MSEPTPRIDSLIKPASPCRILVVDDNQDSARSLGKLVELMGHDVRITYDGAGALDAAKEFQPRIVLLDLGLPGISGYEVARGMRQMAGVQDAIIIAQTGWGQEEDKRRSLEAGINAHLVKPLDLNALQLALERLTQN
jgi:CheY-like chemotaxis protein